jgi:putative endonuclease
MSTWYLYLIECEDGSLYTGITTDVERRYAQHVAGKGARYTRMKKPVRLVGFRECGSKSEALKAEFAFKKLPRCKKELVLPALED